MTGRRGSVAIVLAVTLPALIGMVDLTVTAANLCVHAREAQRACDVASLAGAMSLRAGDTPATAASQAAAVAAINGVVDAAVTIEPGIVDQVDQVVHVSAGGREAMAELFVDQSVGLVR